MLCSRTVYVAATRREPHVGQEHQVDPARRAHFPPAAAFTARARIKPADLEKPAPGARARITSASGRSSPRSELKWQTPFTQRARRQRALPTTAGSRDGRLNASFNCLDVHLDERGHKTAIIFEGEPGDVRRLSYRELHARGVPLRQRAEGARHRSRRPRHHLHAAGARDPGRHARLQPHRRDPLGGVRRLLSAGAQGPHRGHRGASW